MIYEFIFAGILALLIGLLLWVRFPDWNSFLFPNKWNRVIMIEADNSVIDWIQKKNKDLRFEFNNGKYNMFERQISGSGTAVYRSGRLACFIFLEGNENPVDLRNMVITGNPQLQKQLDLIDIANLWTKEETGLLAMISKFMPFIVIAGFLILGYLVLRLQNGTAG